MATPDPSESTATAASLATSCSHNELNNPRKFPLALPKQVGVAEGGVAGKGLATETGKEVSLLSGSGNKAFAPCYCLANCNC